MKALILSVTGLSARYSLQALKALILSVRCGNVNTLCSYGNVNTLCNLSCENVDTLATELLKMLVLSAT